ncbi:MAG: DUF5691 domain-containing protein [Roseiflexaceae bacterium]
MSTPIFWEELVTTALLGTERRQASWQHAPGDLQPLLEQLTAVSDPAQRLLQAALLTMIYRQAGFVPVAVQEAGGMPKAADRCPADTQPACSAQAGRHLEAMLQGQFREVLPEWLAALSQRGLRVPAAQLAGLLGLAKQHDRIQQWLPHVLGERGRWLAAQNPEWQHLATLDLPSDQTTLNARWELGSQSERVALLRALRHAHPAQARDLLQQTWPTEKADQRSEFLELFADQLSIDDEPWLETILDDRSERVRTIAQRLLAQIPTSRLVGRMIERLRPLLQWTPPEHGRLLGLLGRSPAKLIITLPQGRDTAMQRDGISAKPRTSRYGERAWVFAQMLVLVPPSVWSRLWNAAPNVILQAEISGEWHDMVIEGLFDAARAHADQDWLIALAEYAQHEATPISPAMIIASLPATYADSYALALLRTTTHLAGDSPALTMLRNLPGPWSQQLSEVVLRLITATLQQGQQGQEQRDWHLRAALSEFALRIPPALADHAIRATEYAATWPYWSSSVEQFQRLISFRAEMLAALDISV